MAAVVVEEAAAGEEESAAADSPEAAPAMAAGAPSEQDMSEEAITDAELSAPGTAVGAT